MSFNSVDPQWCHKQILNALKGCSTAIHSKILRNCCALRLVQLSDGTSTSVDHCNDKPCSQDSGFEIQNKMKNYMLPYCITKPLFQRLFSVSLCDRWQMESTISLVRYGRTGRTCLRVLMDQKRNLTEFICFRNWRKFDRLFNLHQREKQLILRVQQPLQWCCQRDIVGVPLKSKKRLNPN